MSTAVQCPSCREPLPAAAAACPACGIALTGPAAVELWQVDQQLALLTERRRQLLGDLRGARGPVVPAVTPAPAPPEGRFDAAPAADLSAAPTRLKPESGRGPAQQVLLGVGALLLLVAAAVFLAVTWAALGVVGQVALMAVVTAGAAAGSLALLRAGLRASAEAVALLAVGLAVVDATAAHELNLSGLRQVDGTRYAAVVAPGLAVLLLALAGTRSGRRLATYALAGVLAAAAAPLLAVLSEQPVVTAVTTVFALSAAAFGLAARRLRGRWRWLAVLAAVLAGGYLGLTLLAGLYGTTTSAALGHGGAAALVALAAAAVAGTLGHLHRGPEAALGQHPLLAGSALLAAPALVATAVSDLGAIPLAVLSSTAAATVAVLARSPLRLRRHAGGSAALAALLVIPGSLLFLSFQADLTVVGPGWATLLVSLSVVASSAAMVLLARRQLRVPAAGSLAGVVVVTAAVAAAPSGGEAVGYALVGSAAATAAVAVRVRGTPAERMLATVAGVAAALAIGFAADAAFAPDAGSQPLAVVLAVIGVTALAYAAVPGRGWVAALGVAACSGATWTLLLDADVDTVEAYSLPLAALVGLVGLVRWRRDPRAPSWVTAGPALSAALLPSAVVSTADPALTRPLVVVAAAALVLVLGVVAAQQAPVVVGAVAATLVAVAQLAPYAVGLPRWLTFGVVGLTLLVLGVRYEQRRRNASQALRWLGALH